jgi:hypothetical protein
MKRLISLVSFTLLLVITACGQNQNLEKNLTGEWLLKIDLTKSIEEETKADDELLEKAILSGLSGFIETILDAVEIKFLIHKDGTYSVVVKDEDEEEEEKGNWTVTDQQLIRFDDLDSKKLNVSSDNLWKYQNDTLYTLKDDGSINPNVMLIKMN